MKRLTISDVEIMRTALQQEIIRSDESRYDHRLHGVLLVSHGISCPRVAEWLGQDSRTVQRWVNKFEADGFSGLQEGERLGRPAMLNEVRVEGVNRDLRLSPRELGYSQNLWNGPLLSHHLSHVYKVKLGVRQCQRLFHQLGFRLRKPRAVIAQADPEARAAYKKTASNRSR